MQNLKRATLFAGCLLLSLFISPLRAQTRHLVWSDEFESTTINLADWSFDLGTSNDNIHYYTDRSNNAKILNGMLNILALKETYQGFKYTSALLKTKHRVNLRYGRVEARIKLPGGKGFVPAFWMLPDDDFYGWWPASGEIDIMEHPTNLVDQIYGTVHTGAYNSFSGSGPRGGTVRIADAESAFHVYAVEWTPEKIDFFIDDAKYFTFSKNHSGSATWPFDQPFYIILNLAVGGGWVGEPDGSTPFPAIMQVDYVRVYQNPGDVGIRGDDFVVAESMQKTYSVPDLNGADYTWSVPSGARIVKGQSTAQITVDWGSFGGNVACRINTTDGTFAIEKPVVLSLNHLKNGGFEKGVKYWNKTGPYPAEADFLLTTTQVHTGVSALYVNVKTPGVNPWDAQLSQRDIQLQAGKKYRVSFWARSVNSVDNITAAIIHSTNYTLYANQSIALTNTWQQYTLNFTAPASVSASLNIDLGGHTGQYYFDDFMLVMPDVVSANQLLNADFSAGESPWVFNTFTPAQATGTVENGEFAIMIQNGGVNVWDIFLGQTNLFIEKDKEYTVTFDAYASGGRTVSALVGRNSDPWTVYSGSQIIPLTTEKRTYSCTFIMREPTDNQARLGFDVGTSTEDIYFDNIFLSRGAWPNAVSRSHSHQGRSFHLAQNYPNPFNSSTNIAYTVENPGHVQLAVFNVQGQMLQLLVDTFQNPGDYQVNWPADNLPSGIYLCMLVADDFSEIRKLVLQK